MTPKQVRAQIASGQLDPVYAIMGDDEVEMSELAADISGIVEEELRPFNVDRLHASDKTTKPHVIVQSARTLPMLGDRRVVLVLRAERLLKPKRKSKDEEPGGDEEGDAAPVDALVDYIKSPERQTTLVFVGEDANRTTKLWKALQKHATIVECWGLRGSRDAKVDLRQAARAAEELVRTAVQRAGKQIEPAAVRLLAQRAGADIMTLRGDLERLLLYAGEQTKIGLKDVQEVVSGESLHDDWAVANAIERGDTAEALKQVVLSLDGGTAPEQLLGQLAYVVREKLRDVRRIPAAVDALFRTDLELKSTRAEARVLLERLVVELCGG